MEIRITKTFKRNIETLKKKHYPVENITVSVNAIVNNDSSILSKVKDHALHSSWAGFREFHPGRLSKNYSIYDDWIVVYKIENKKITLTLVSTGNHNVL